MQIPYVGADTLPPGWHRSTAGLISQCQRALQAGLAPMSAPHVRQPAMPLGERTPLVNTGIAQLEEFLTPETEFRALGMAYNQLQIAAETGPLSVFAVMTNLAGLTPADRPTGKAEVFINPHLYPVESKGRAIGVEPCFSTLGLVPEVERWRAVVLTSVNLPPVQLQGASAIVVQHEFDHILGKLAVEVAFQTDLQVFYVPPEVEQIFFEDYHKKGRRHYWPHRLIRQQGEAMLNGEYSPLNHT